MLNPAVDGLDDQTRGRRGRGWCASPLAQNRRAAGVVVVTLLMIVHAGLLLAGARRNFVVVDEAAHVPAGISHWQTGDFSLYRVNPPLGRMLAALPVMLARPRVDFDLIDPTPGLRVEWAAAQRFAELNGSRYSDLIMLARLPGVAWSLLVAWVIFLWGRELHGDAGGCVGAALWCFDPTVLAFAQVVTPDVPAAAAGVWATYVFQRSLQRPSWFASIGAGLLLGVALLTKFTLLVLPGVWLLLWIGSRRPWREPASPRRWAKRCRKGLAVVMLSLYVVNLGYAFQDSFRPLGNFTFLSRFFRGSSSSDGPFGGGNRFRGGWLGAVPVPVPAEYVQGIDAQRLDFESQLPSYLGGEWRTRGWWYYYVYALAVKEPLGTWALVLWSLALTLARRPRGGANDGFLWVPVAVFLVFVSSQTGFSRHMRYVLPLFPFAALAADKTSIYLVRGRWAGIAVLGLVAWSAAGSLAVFPHSMSYFNETVGGPIHGGEHLLDSNIDWGQDLLYLKQWLDQHPEARPLGLAYCHILDPRMVGIDFRLPPPGPYRVPRGDDDAESWAAFGPRPGYFAVSVNFLHGMTTLAPDGLGGWWWIGRSDSFAYFRAFRPIARAGYSIFIYRITPAEAEVERRRLGLPPLPAEGRE